MTTNTKKQDRKKINHRHFLMVVAAGIVAVGLVMGTASAKTIIPGKDLKTNATKGGKRVAIINDALMQLGPPLALMLAERGHNLVIAQHGALEVASQRSDWAPRFAFFRAIAADMDYSD